MPVQGSWQSRQEPYERRNIGSCSVATDQILLDAAAYAPYEVVEIVLQPDIDTVVQILDNGVPVGGLWTLKAAEAYSEPAFIPSERFSKLTLSISNAAVVQYEVRYVKGK